MKLPVLAAALAALLPAAWAAGPADPAAPVPAPAYRSVFEGIPAGVEEGSVPWTAANAAVAEFPRGHIDLLKWENARSQAPAAATAAPALATPAPAPQGAATPPAAGGAHRH